MKCYALSFKYESKPENSKKCKSRVSSYPKSGKIFVENMLQKILFSSCYVKFIFPMALAVAGSALGLILFCFHSVRCFMMREKILVFKQIILFRKIKFGGD